MTFSKSFPKIVKGSNYPRWEEVFLTESEEKIQEFAVRFQEVFHKVVKEKE